MDAAPTENPIIMNVMSVYGYMVIGGAISCALWGIGCMQMYVLPSSPTVERLLIFEWRRFLYFLKCVIDTLREPFC